MCLVGSSLGSCPWVSVLRPQLTGSDKSFLIRMGMVLSLLCCLGGVSVSLGWERALSRQELEVSFSFHLGKQQRGRQWSDWGLASLQRRVLEPRQAW